VPLPAALLLLQTTTTMKHFVLSAALSLTASALFAQNAPPVTKHVITPAAIHQLDSLFHYLDSTGLFNGNILVAVGGKPVASAAMGYANLSTKERLTQASTFEMASVSKQFVAFGVLRLVANGKLQLDQQLSSVFPELPYKGITIRHLLNHTSGLPDYMDLLMEHWDKSKIATNKDVIAMLVQYLPEKSFEPGTKWEYSNTGYAVLASVIEKVSGKSFAGYMQDEVFAPLGLRHTTIYRRRYEPRTIPGYAYGYVCDSDKVFRLPDEVAQLSFVRFLDGIGGDGSVNTTLGDMLIWDNAVRDGKLLPAGLWKEAIASPVINGKKTEYGFGFSLDEKPGTGRVLTHNGGWPGYITRNDIYLDKDVALIFFNNKEQAQAIVEGTWRAVRNITFGRPFKFPAPLVQKETTIDTQLYRLYTGTYESAEMKGFELIIKSEEGKLIAQATGQNAFEIKPESANIFFFEGQDIRIEFMRGEDGKEVRKLVLHQNGDHDFLRKM
jgi:CubicO group peptidase (beta-lactamase class C family)